MAIDPELIADRRRLRRKLSFWRVLGVLAAIAAVVTIGATVAGRSPFRAAQNQIARISIEGFITGDQQRMRDLFRRVAEASNVSGVVVSINSPGGATTGAEELFQGIRRLSERKPLVAFVSGTAASGGYVAALGADHIVVRETSLVGSVGVLFQYPDFSKLLSSVGVHVEEIKSAPLKAEPSPFHPTSPEAREALRQVVADTYEWFKRLVVERRKLGEAELATVSTGRIFNGRQSLPLKLVDAVGSERDAVAWLEREKGVAANLPVRDWKPRSSRDFNLWTAASLGADVLGFSDLAEKLRRAAVSAEAANLDGLLAVWHPASEK
jgi:protease IV